MFLVTVILKSSQHVLQFHFNELKTANAQIDKYDSKDASIVIEDSFGSRGNLVRSEISAMFLTDLDREMDAAEIVDLARYKKDMKVQTKLSNQNPSILTPRRGSN